MGPLLGFIVGVIFGVIVAWWFYARRDADSRAAIEAGWKKKFDHVEAEVRRADAAHEETKALLRRLQQERLPAPGYSVPNEPTPGEPLLPQGEAERLAQARRRIDAKLAQLPAGSSARQRLLAERAALDAGGQPAPSDGPPRLFTPPDRPADDLERIRGIGPVIKQQLNRLGITTFEQIAAFTDDDLARIDAVLDFKGRIAREGWIEQARALHEAR